MFARTALRAAQPLKMVRFTLAPTDFPRGGHARLFGIITPYLVPRFSHSALSPAVSKLQTGTFELTIGCSPPHSKPAATPTEPAANVLLLQRGADRRPELAGRRRRGVLRSSSGSPAVQKAEAAVGVAPKKALTGGDQGFVSLKLEAIENVNHNTKKFRFALPEGDMVSGLDVASAVLTKYKGPEDEKATLRPYTPISDEDAKGYVDLLVKKYPNGPMSTHMHDMAPGQRLDFKGPLPKYPWTPNKHEHIALVAGGTGITPMYQLARAIFSNPDDKTKVTLVFGNVTEEDILLKKEFAELENTYPQRFRAFYVLDKPPKEWVGGKGFITKELLKQVLPEPKSENIKVFVCGPPGLMNAVSGNKKSPKDQGELVGVLKELGYSPDQVYKF